MTKIKDSCRTPTLAAPNAVGAPIPRRKSTVSGLTMGMASLNIQCFLAAGLGVWKTFRPVIGLQLLCTVAATLIAGWLAGVHGGISAAVGGLISVVAGLVFAALVSRSKGRSSAEVLLVAFRAEAAKLALIVVLLWLVLANYQEVVVLGLIGSFSASVLIFTMAVFVRDS